MMTRLVRGINCLHITASKGHPITSKGHQITSKKKKKTGSQFWTQHGLKRTAELFEVGRVFENYGKVREGQDWCEEKETNNKAVLLET